MVTMGLLFKSVTKHLTPAVLAALTLSCGVPVVAEARNEVCTNAANGCTYPWQARFELDTYAPQGCSSSSCLIFPDQGGGIAFCGASGSHGCVNLTHVTETVIWETTIKCGNGPVTYFYTPFIATQGGTASGVAYMGWGGVMVSDPTFFDCNDPQAADAANDNDPCRSGMQMTSFGAGVASDDGEDDNQLVKTQAGVNLGVGSGYVERVDRQPVSLPGATRSAGLAFGRYQTSRNKTLTPFRGGWSHTYNVWLADMSNTVSITDWQGSWRSFTLTNGVYVGDGSSTLVQTNGAFVWRLPHGTKYVFDSMHGLRLSNITDRVGSSVTLRYDAAGSLTGAVDSVGRQLKFGYNVDAQLVQVLDAIGRTNSFTYDAVGRLASASDSLGVVGQYVYGDAIFSNAITRLINARGYTNSFVYDANGRVVAETNALGHVQSYSWGTDAVTVTQFDGTTYTVYNNSSGAMTSRVDAAGVTDFYRDARHRVTDIVDRLNNITSFYYNTNGCGCGITGTLAMQVDALGRTNAWTYEPTFNFPVTFTNAAGGVTTWSYDSKGNVTAVTNAAGKATRFWYDGSGNLTNVTDANGNATRFRYDSYGNRTNVIDALGNTNSLAYDLVGMLHSRTDALGRIELFAWDDRDRLTAHVDPAKGTNTWQYDGNGNLTAWMNPLRYTRSYAYDALDRLVSVTLPASGAAFLTYAYDAMGNLTNVTDALGNKTGFGYDALGRLTAITNALGKAWLFTVDAEGRRIRSTDPLGRVNGFVVDAVGQVTGWTNALGHFSAFTYDKLGNLVSVTDPRTNALTFGYDAVSQLTNLTYAGATSETFRYDAVGNLTGFVNRAGQTVALTYDAANRLTQKSYVGTNDVIKFVYDAAGQLTGLVWTAGANVTNAAARFRYDAAGRLTNETQQAGNSAARSVGYQYFADGRRSRLTYPDNSYVTYVYNSNGWLTAIKDTGTNNIVSYEYDAAGRRIKRTLENNSFTVYEYDKAGQLTNLWHRQSTGSSNTICQFQYGYDAVGNRAWVKRPHQTNLGDVYRYDSADQLTNVIYNVTNPDTTPTGGTNDTRYVFDAAGNRTAMQVINGVVTNTTSYGVNALNQYTNVANAVYRYDAKGNLTNDGSRAYFYDYENRLRRVVVGGTNTLTYTYDALGRLVQQTASIGTVTSRYYYAGWQLIAEYNQAGTFVRKYVYGDGLDEPVRMTAGTRRYYYHPDGLGSVATITTNSGLKAESYTYDVYGAPTIYNGAGTAITSSAMTNRLLFTARDYDATTRLYNYRHRYYVPGVGRFLQPDPIGLAGGDLNLYRYVGNNPGNGVDPLGLEWTSSDQWNLVIGLRDQAYTYVMRGGKDQAHINALLDAIREQTRVFEDLKKVEDLRRASATTGAVAAGGTCSLWGLSAGGVLLGKAGSAVAVAGWTGVAASGAVGYGVGRGVDYLSGGIVSDYFAYVFSLGNYEPPVK